MSKVLKLFRVNNQPVAAVSAEQAIALYKLNGSECGRVQNVYYEETVIVAENVDLLENETQKMTDIEKESIKKALTKNLGNRKKAAAALGITERTLYRRLEEYGLCKED